MKLHKGRRVGLLGIFGLSTNPRGVADARREVSTSDHSSKVLSTWDVRMGRAYSQDDLSACREPLMSVSFNSNLLSPRMPNDNG
jgi:hypothetical protein